ncbi:uncharacterized protein LOC110600515 [Manihot esculenta]|uniref:Uncharacterized protein n=1 Tax=Manihot esculenta TaxID=3983 RepID=A0ACB7GHP5_MANES|nr:uncharacterized protein LOC110600515 [Manihot esculenta]KAG8639399.1 hypothetical protein MANES_14G138428v8 [Manihot esculenta]
MEESKPSSTPPSSSPSSLKQKLKLRYPFFLSSSFRRTNPTDSSSPSVPDASQSSKLLRTTSAGIKSRAHDKCKNFISRIGRNGQAQPQEAQGHGYGRGHRRRHSVSADFRYDAMSYALNFDEGNDESPENDFRLRSFSSRLPQSPKREIECS